MTFITPSENANAKVVANRGTGRQIFNQAFNALKQDTRVLLVPVIAFLVNLVLFAVIGVSWILLIPVMSIYNSTTTINYVLGALLYVVFACTHVFSQAIIMSAANDIFEGKKADLSAATKSAFSRFGSLFLFAIIESTVGLILRTIADNLKGVAGALVRIIGGLAWAVASYFAIPGILFDGLGPFKSIGQSGRLIKAKWGNVMRTNIAAGAVIALLMLAGFGAIFGGVFAFVTANSGTIDSINWNVGAILLFVSGIGLVLFAGLLQGAILAFLKVALYRFAKDEKSVGFESGMLSAGFKVKN